ncbi:MAG: glucose-6-phosphate isomerase [Candidatus Syntrophoarchaeum sp. WYZ-LMO15]|nr:MAG: glucose-6-phosphate isomerase [Candidatus Syntrophoarchaeum sp. WYZ-LMO15]
MDLPLNFGGQLIRPDVRRLSDMRELLFDRSFAESAEDMDLYYMYRDLYLSRKDQEKIREAGLRYDITIIPPLMLGKEYVKTAGHYHPPADGGGITYPEVYEVLEGEAHYLLQRPEGDKIVDVVLITAEEGEKVLIPPGYGHITINPSNKRLKMANWVARGFSSIYDPIRKRRGGAYYETVDGFVKNDAYGEIPPLRFLRPKDLPMFGLVKAKEMYGLVRENIKLLEFLTRPWEFVEVFEKVLE